MAWKFNPFTKKLDYYETGSTTPVLTFKPGVASAANLPTEGNTENDARIANDTHHLYIWSGTAWVDQGDIIDISWGSLTGTLSNQTDLQNALNAKADSSTTYTETEVDNLLNEKLTSNVAGITFDLYDSDYVFRSVAYSASLNRYVGVGGGSGARKTGYSSDGISWTWAASPSTSEMSKVIWIDDLNLFVAVGGGGTNTQRAIYSSDGISWNIGSTPNKNVPWYDLAWSSSLNLLVAVAYESSDTNIMTSTNGTSWTDQGNAGLSASFNCIYWADTESIFIGGLTNDKIATSSDGLTWTQRYNGGGASAYYIKDITKSDSKFIAIRNFVSGSNSTSYFVTSLNGIDWSLSESSSSNCYLTSIVYNTTLSKFYAVGSRILTSTNTVGYSTNGEDWVFFENLPANDFSDIIYDVTNNKLIAVAYASTDSIFISRSYLSDANGTEYPYFTSNLKTKLDGIEASAVALTTVKADTDIADAISKKHSANTDTGLDTGGSNPITAANLVKGAIEIILDGAGSAITTGIKGDFQIPYPCEIQSATLLADQTGSIQVDIWKDTYANFPPTDADSITSSAPVVISSAVSSTDSTLTGWTKTIAAGSVLRFNVDSCTSITRCTLILTIKRT